MLQEKVKEILRSAGWYEGRKIDVSHYKKELEEIIVKTLDNIMEESKI